MQAVLHNKISLLIFLPALMILSMISISECPAQDTDDQNLPDNYRAICENILPSLAVVYKIEYGATLILAQHSLFIYTTGGDSAWGCIINENGDLLTVRDILMGPNGARGYTYVSYQNASSQNPRRDFDFKKIISKSILNDYVVVSTNMDKSDFIPSRIITSPIDTGDSIFILVKPFFAADQIVGGSIKAIRNDPLLGEMIEIEPLKGIPQHIALAYNGEGELYGFVLSTRLLSPERVFAVSAANLSRLASKDEKELKELTEDTLFEIDEEIRKTFTNGLIMFWQGEYDSAQVLFQEVIKTKPDYALAYVYFAACNLHKGNSDRAEEYYLKAFELNNELDEAQYQLAHLYFDQDRTDNAIDAYKTAISANGNNPFYYYELGMIYKDLGKKKATKRMHAKLKRLDRELAGKLME